MVTRAPRLLVKAVQMPQGAAFNVGKVPFTLHPLFPGARRAGAMGAAPASEWHLTDIPTDVDESDLWDLCHQLQTKGFGIAGGPTVEFAEPRDVAVERTFLQAVYDSARSEIGAK